MLTGSDRCSQMTVTVLGIISVVCISSRPEPSAEPQQRTGNPCSAESQSPVHVSACASCLLPAQDPAITLGACVVGFAGFREAYRTQRGAICLNGSVGKDDCNNCRLLNMHVWRLIHVLHSKPNIQDRWLFLKIAWLLQNKQGNIDETAKAHLIPVL